MCTCQLSSVACPWFVWGWIRWVVCLFLRHKPIARWLEKTVGREFFDSAAVRSIGNGGRANGWPKFAQGLRLLLVDVFLMCLCRSVTLFFSVRTAPARSGPDQLFTTTRKIYTMEHPKTGVKFLTRLVLKLYSRDLNNKLPITRNI